MLYLNQELLNFRGRSLFDLTLPQFYEATSIKDFLDNKQGVKPTRSFSPFIIYDLSGKRNVIFNPFVLGLLGKAFIDIPSVNYRITEEGVDQLYDVTGSIDVVLHWSLVETRTEVVKPEPTTSFSWKECMGTRWDSEALREYIRTHPIWHDEKFKETKVNMVPQGHLYEVWLLYSQAKDRAILSHVEQGPPSPEMKESSKRLTLERLLPQLQPN